MTENKLKKIIIENIKRGLLDESSCETTENERFGIKKIKKKTINLFGYRICVKNNIELFLTSMLSIYEFQENMIDFVYFNTINKDIDKKLLEIILSNYVDTKTKCFFIFDNNRIVYILLLNKDFTYKFVKFLL